MFRMLDTTEFGSQIRKMREELNFTRKQVEELTGVNKETLRKIERGDVVPQITTLQLLSVEYRTDLIKTFNTYKNNNLLLNTNNLIDELLLTHSGTTDTLEHYKITPDDTEICNYIDPVELSQFNSFIDYLPVSNLDDKEKKYEAIEGLFDSLRMHHDEFELNNLELYSYSYIEHRILFVCGVIYAELKEYDLSNTIFNFLYTHLSIDDYSSSKSKQLYIKLLCNIAYNHHSLDHHALTYEIATTGIDICNKYNSGYLLEVLIYRKAVAQYFLNDPETLKTFGHVRAVLEIKGYTKQLEIYSKVTKEKYNIDF